MGNVMLTPDKIRLSDSRPWPYRINGAQRARGKTANEHRVRLKIYKHIGRNKRILMFTNLAWRYAIIHVFSSLFLSITRLCYLAQNWNVAWNMSLIT